jgi:hypothetical protein
VVGKKSQPNLEKYLNTIAVSLETLQKRNTTSGE